MIRFAFFILKGQLADPGVGVACVACRLTTTMPPVPVEMDQMIEMRAVPEVIACLIWIQMLALLSS